jgi:hypothetical protein
VGSGRYRFAAWDRRRQLTFAADTANYRGRPRFDRVVWTVTGDPAAALAAVLSGQADVYEQLRGEAYAKAGASPRLKTVEYGSLDYAYLAFNLRPRGGRPSAFADRAARVALTQAIDRAAVVTNVLGPLGRVALGPFTRAQATADTTLRQIAYDPAAAARALDSLGWRPGPGGARARGGRPLAASLLVPSTSAPRMRMAVLLQEQLARVGVQGRGRRGRRRRVRRAHPEGRLRPRAQPLARRPEPDVAAPVLGHAARRRRRGQLRPLGARRLRRAARQRRRRVRPGAAHRARARRLPDHPRRGTGGVAVRAAQRGRRAPRRAPGGDARRRVVGGARRLAARRRRPARGRRRVPVTRRRSAAAPGPA